MEKKNIHIISHTHWDREWYMPFEAHRYKLVEFFDRLLHTLDTDPTFKSFHLDGQAIVIEDYLEIRPEMREKIVKYIADGRLVIGPWYILQDEYLIDGESNVRNMIVGRKICSKYGKYSDTGYFPDAFGNIGQAPQILRGFGIDTVAFGRGTSERKGDRLDTGEENYGKHVSEVIWRSPDGSEVLGTTFLRWYNNANEIPSEPDEAAKRIEAIRDSVASCSVCDDLLFLNGCDHQPVQTDIGQIAEKVDEMIPDHVMHSTYHDYFEAIRPYKDKFGIFVGELDGEYGSGWDTLANTASARIYLKQLNTRCESLLEKTVEPLNVYSSLFASDEIRRDYSLFLWKTLLQNHPHDSICGCSVDDVHSEMVTRFKKVLAAGKSVAADELDKFMSVVDTASVGTDKVITVFNSNGFVSSEAVVVNVDFPENTDVTPDMLAVYDGDKALPIDVEDLGVVFDYILPKDKFRIPFNTRRFRVTFNAAGVPALGYKSFAVKTDGAKAESGINVYKRGMSNDRVRVKFQNDGSLTVIDRKNGEEVTTGIMVDTGDVGDEYIYRQSPDGVTVSTEGTRAKIELVHSSAASATFKVTHNMTIPSGVDRKEGKRTGSCEMVIENYFTLRCGADRLDVKTVIHNNAENHRVVMLTKNDIKTDVVLAEGQFDIVERPIKPWDGWRNPTKPGKMTTFFGLEDDRRGILIAGRGLCEYEVLHDGSNTMSLTLHRGVDQLGDWGYFPTPDAQCKGTLTVEYSFIPFVSKKSDRERAINEAYSFAAYEPTAICAPAHEGTKAATDSILGVSGSGFVVSAVKMGENSDNVILRVYNPNTYDTKMKIDIRGKFKSVYNVNLAEERQSKIIVRNGVCNLSVPHKKIITLELVPDKK